MANIPDQPVVRRVEYIMKRNGQLDHAKACAKVAAGLRHGIDHLGTQFVRNSAQLLCRQRAQVCGNIDEIERRCIGSGQNSALRKRICPLM